VIVAVVVVLSFFNSWGTDGSFGNQDTDRSVLAAVGKSITPALAPMGISEDNWPATVGMLTGIFAKETVVGTLNALYGSLAGDAATAEGGEGASFDLWGGIGAAFATIPVNLAELADRIPGGRIVTIPAGHHIHAERPEEFVAAVHAFLKA